MSPYLREVVITNPLGIHARPSSLIVQKVSKLGNHDVFIRRSDCPGIEANMKSIMQIMALGIACGEKVVVFTKDDCDKARETVDAMADLIGSDFGEIY